MTDFQCQTNEAFFSEFVEQKFIAMYNLKGIPFTLLQLEHPSIQLRLLRRLAMEIDLVPSAVQLEAVLRWKPVVGGRLPMTKDFELIFDGQYLSYQKK